MARVFGYIRHGGPDSASHQGQQQNIESYCETHGHELVRIYTDCEPNDDRSGESDRIMLRPGLQDLLADLREQEIEFVVAFNTSRLWRSDIAKVLIHREFRRAEVDVRAIAQPSYSIYDSQAKDNSWYWIEGMIDLLVQYEQLSGALRMRRGRIRKASGGGYAGGRPPFGYKVCKETNALIVDPEKAPVVRRVFDLATVEEDNLSLTLQEIADRLNEEGHTTAHGKPFQRVQVKRILDRKAFYEGHYSYGSVAAPGGHEPLLSC